MRLSPLDLTHLDDLRPGHEALSMESVLAAAARLGLREIVAEIGEGYGSPCLLLGGEALDVPHHASAQTTGAEVRAAIASIDETPGTPTSLFLSYEAGVAAMGEAAGRAYRAGPGLAARVVRHRSGVIFCDGTPHLFGHGDALEALVAEARGGTVPAAGPLPALEVPGKAARNAHFDRVQRLRASIADGDVYQANLAHTLGVPVVDFGDGLQAFAAAISAVAPPFCCVVDLPGQTLLSFSPECFLRFDPGVVSARPIKGTRPRGVSEWGDDELRRDLERSVKDAAEHDMIVDLLRDDLSCIAAPGEVTVTAHRRVLSVQNVHHLESEVTAKRANANVALWISAAIPAGSISGAPKSTAVQFISALEDGPRGPYTGHFGVFLRGQGTLNILIRTWERRDKGRGALKVGGGIVWASDQDEEWQETLDKSAAMR